MKIFINSLETKAIIGLLEKEREKKQKIVIDCEIEYDFHDGFIDYTVVAKIIKKMIKKERFKLLEDALLQISKKLKKKFNQIKSIKIKITKPDILQKCAVGAEFSKKY